MALLAQEYFCRSDTAARQLQRLQLSCDAKHHHIETTLEARVQKACDDFAVKILPKIAYKLDNNADRIARIVQKIINLQTISRQKLATKSNILESDEITKQLAGQLENIEANLASINALFGEVDEKANFLSKQLTTLTENELASSDKKDSALSEVSPAPSLYPLFKSTENEIRLITADIQKVKEDIDRMESMSNQF